jgi:hypothetical protein
MNIKLIKSLLILVALTLLVIPEPSGVFKCISGFLIGVCVK